MNRINSFVAREVKDLAELIATAASGLRGPTVRSTSQTGPVE